MNEFRGYEKIFESSSHWILEKSDISLFKRSSWCVTEKIHGANFCFVCDQNGNRIQCAKRTGLLSNDDDFFGYKRRLFDRIVPRVQALFEHVKQTNSSMSELCVFGELFGGFYPHPDIPRLPDVVPVQTGIWYSPDIEFCAFDLAIKVDEVQHYLDYEYVLSACERIGLLCAEPLMIGKYEDAIDYPLGFQTRIPNRLGLPALTQDNKAEGIVIKPMRELQVKTNKGHLSRAIVKKKIEEFSEEKYNQAQKAEVKKDGQLTNIDLLRFEIDALITENRLHNALSKVGRVTTNDREKLKELLNIYQNDVMEQLLDESNEVLWTNLVKQEQETLTDEIATAIKRMILKYLKTTASDSVG